MGGYESEISSNLERAETNLEVAREWFSAGCLKGNDSQSLVISLQ